MATPEKHPANENMIEYYARRAMEYERIYQKPERQKDIHYLIDILRTVFKDQDVLEIACGTGYWTQYIAESAGSILATDYNRQVIDVAKHKNYKNCKVSFEESDAYSLSNVNGHFTGGFCGFWWSHIPRARIQGFLRIFHDKLQDDALVVMMDNKYVEGSSTRLSRTDSDGNTYQLRRLQDGSLHEVLKNFPTQEEIKTNLEGCSKNFYFIDLDYYWLVKYQVKKV
jgi:SAM-dependent methyltransferase